MNFKIKLVSLILATLLIYLLSPKAAFADFYTISGHISDSSGAEISGAIVSINDANFDSSITDSSGNYSLYVPDGTYNIQVTPPAGSNFSSAIALDQVISGNTTLNFILAPAGTAVLSGHVYDSQGNGVSGQHVGLFNQSGNQVESAITDSSGKYSLQATAGIYAQLQVIGSLNNNSLNVPENYNLIVHDYSIMQSTILDITVPADEVSIHVQDASNNPVPGVKISTSGSGTYSIGGGITDAYGGNSYDASGPVTDGSGNVTLWLFPATYTLTATPPSGSNYSSFSLSNINVTGSTQETITLPQPVTLNGHVYDSLGNGVSGQHVGLFNQSGSQVESAITDSSGNYSLQTNTGTYAQLQIIGSLNGTSLNVPENYNFVIRDYSITQSTTLDIAIPADQVSVHIQDALGNPVSGVKISTSGSGTYSIGGGITSAYGGNSYDASGPATDSSGNVTLWLLPTTYTLTATPPNGNNYSTFSLPNVTVAGDTQASITLPQPVTLSGHIYNNQGGGVPGQHVGLFNDSGNEIEGTVTDSSGNYSLQANTGMYAQLQIVGSFNSASLNIPENYNLIVRDYSLTQSTVLDITIPADQVSIHVQDSSNNPVPGVKISTSGNGTYSIGGGITDAYGGNSYDASGLMTDAEGNATLWLFPAVYTFTATPPSGSIYSTSTLNNVTVNGNQTELISLQYSHNPPTTTATLSPTPNLDGKYTNPATVTLSATAISGYTIANTYYTIDEGAQQTYSSPFSVSGVGDHTITYWSIDNSGVQEAHNSKTFTIAVAPTPTPIQLTSLSPAKVWVGVKNSDDIGIKFDLKAEVYKDNTLISSGEIDSVSGGSSGFAHAQLGTIPFNTFSPIDLSSGSQLSIKIYARNACSGSGKNSGTARLWYNDSQANSRFNATIAANTSNYFLLNNSKLGISSGTGPKLTSDLSAGTKCSPFKSFGTWTITP